MGQKDTITLAPKMVNTICDVKSNCYQIYCEQTMPFWPVNTQSCKLTISINDSTHMTKPFPIMNTDTVLLKTEGNVTRMFSILIYRRNHDRRARVR